MSSKLPHSILQQIWSAQSRKRNCLQWSDCCFHFLCYHSHICSSLTWQVTAEREVWSDCQLMAQHQNRPISKVPICCLGLCLFPACSGSQELSWKLWPLCTAVSGQFLQCCMLSKELLTGAGEWKYCQHLSYLSLKRSPQTSWGPFKTAGWSRWQKKSFYPCTSILWQKLPCVVEGINVLNILFIRLKSYSNLTLMKTEKGD